MVRPRSSAWRSLTPMSISTFTDDFSFESSLLELVQYICLCELTQYLIDTKDTSIDPLCVNVSLYLVVSHKPRVRDLMTRLIYSPLQVAICSIRN